MTTPTEVTGSERELVEEAARRITSAGVTLRDRTLLRALVATIERLLKERDEAEAAAVKLENYAAEKIEERKLVERRADAMRDALRERERRGESLAAFLENIIARFHACAVSAGNSREHADASVENARGALHDWRALTTAEPREAGHDE